MAALNVKFGHEEVGKYSYAVQGVGHVGMEFVKLLRERGAKVFVTDINQKAVARAVDEFGAEAVGLDEIYDVPADVFSPCALGGTINEKTLPASRPGSSAARPTTSWPPMRSATSCRSAASCTRRTTRSTPAA
jgi:glutamate dehydrogenase/leucine dehydrogenase